eukprot:TRINITY_DN112929_c0_g1_i1.p1 TRINITY_DN112929_c0_g1~~TRINITY_DN112929_c0_g1_i1.p1  ORF type:complete len:273 (+),score=26.35 TRINITY_DN112929_c0_g1_i1:23-820(+)
MYRWSLLVLLTWLFCWGTVESTVLKSAGQNNWHAGGCESINAINSTWWYNWRPFPSPCNQTQGIANFIPMIWGKEEIKYINQVDRNADALLGFNEPDVKSQSNMTPKEAASLWHHLESTGMRLGSPAVGTGSEFAYMWLDEFFRHCKGCRVDFVAVHWYAQAFSHNSKAGCNKTALFDYIRFFATRYKRPVWVTEFSCILSSAEANLEFMKTTLPYIHQASPMLERYSWFAINDQGGEPSWDGIALVEKANTTSLTKLGRYFKSL